MQATLQAERVMNFEEIYNRLFKPVLAYVQSRVQNAAAAADIASRVWQRAFERQHQYQPEKGLADQWIFGIARNEVNKYFGFWGIKRFLSLTPREEIFPSKEDMPPEQLERQELNRRLLGSLQRLDSRERDLVSLKIYGGLNNRQIARLTGYSESNVGTILSRAVHKLRTLLGGL